MIRHPYGHDELDRTDPALDDIAEQLQGYASDQRGNPPVDLAARIHAALRDEPDTAIGWWARFAGPLSPWRTPARGFAAAAVVAAAVVVALVAGDLADVIRSPGNVEPSPSPSVVLPPTPSPTLPPSPSPTESPSPSPETPDPSASDDSGGAPETPDPSASDDSGGAPETPEPSESDNSGPGGGGGDRGNSGPGGGGGNSGSGSGD